MGKTKRFKRIYIEITNLCNLSCSFCQPTLRAKRTMTVAEFDRICGQIKPYTDYIYLHVKGEPLLHPQFRQILQTAGQHGLKVNITTNGTLIEKQLDTLLAYPPHQLNLSFHSASDNIGVDFDQYVKKLFYALQTLYRRTNCYMNLRLWAMHGKLTLFGLSNVKILDRLYISIASEFEWPDIANSYYEENGMCQGLKTHVAILCDGTVVPCCLDGNAGIVLGNILKDPFEEILCRPRTVIISNEFSRHRRAYEELCRHCSYKERFTKK